MSSPEAGQSLGGSNLGPLGAKEAEGQHGGGSGSVKVIRTNIFNIFYFYISYLG